MVDSLRYEGGYITILLGPTVNRAVVLNWTELSVLLLDEEEIGGVRAPRFSNSSSCQVFGYELVDLLYFELG